MKQIFISDRSKENSNQLVFSYLTLRNLIHLDLKKFPIIYFFETIAIEAFGDFLANERRYTMTIRSTLFSNRLSQII